jgi:hypothetical protein
MSSSENLSGRTLGQAAGDAPRGRRQIRIASEEFRKSSVDEFFFDDEEFPKSPEGNKIITADTINELLENMSSGKILMPRSKMGCDRDVFEKSTIFGTHEALCSRFGTQLSV